MVLGHEISGTIAAAAEGVSLSTGQRVAINPSLPCGECEKCREGMRNHCSNMQFLGSAMRSPHVDGGFRDFLVCDAAQAFPIPDSLSFAEAALAEPAAVCLHALAQAGDLVGRAVLITGAGPIGLLLVALCRMAGAARIVVTDRLEAPLKVALATGADHVIDVGNNSAGVDGWTGMHGRFDLHFEASGSGPALLDGLAALRPKGLCVLVGQGAEITLQVSSLISREIEIRSSFRFDREFGTALFYLGAGRLQVAHLVTATLPAAQANAAFDLALDKTKSVKVQLDFS
jgi:L-idonate 5-dehydrogenase